MNTACSIAGSVMALPGVLVLPAGAAPPLRPDPNLTPGDVLTTDPAVVMLLFGISLILDIRTKLATVDEQADDEIVHLHGLRETDCSSGEALEARPQR